MLLFCLLSACAHLVSDADHPVNNGSRSPNHLSLGWTHQTTALDVGSTPGTTTNSSLTTLRLASSISGSCLINSDATEIGQTQSRALRMQHSSTTLADSVETSSLLAHAPLTTIFDPVSSTVCPKQMDPVSTGLNTGRSAGGRCPEDSEARILINPMALSTDLLIPEQAVAVATTRPADHVVSDEPVGEEETCPKTPKSEVFAPNEVHCQILETKV
ncbi:unnamed protein product [Protopolystoma xenopodis]|uniref:Uncharacterized protein n=1 Tax=Protopolystoma xenopodis TaxID=117903 RepID=A0A448WMV7_9PLAT|nr:unnamed protein product [Protopolystoma xenopodis]